MSEFQTTLAAFLAGRAEFGQLDAALLRSLQADPAIGPAAYAAIDELRRNGRLPLQLFVVLKNRIAQSHATGAPRPAAPRQEAAPAPRQEPPPPMPRSEPISGPDSLGAAPQTGGDRTVFGAQRPRGGTGTGTTSTSRVAAPDGAPAGNGAATPSPVAAPDVSRAAPPPPPPAPAEPPAAAADRTTLGARRQPPNAGASQPHSVRPADPSVPGAMSAGVDTSPTGATESGRTGSQLTGRTGTTGATGTGSGWSDPAKWADQPSIALERGAVLKSRFVLENVVGRGGMGVVFRAKDLRKEEAQDRDPYVAIKILNDEFRRHPESLKALQREARKSQALAHPNIVNVFDFDRDGATVYMTMEFLEGESLDRIIKSPQFEGFPLEEAFPLVDGLGQALRYAHNKQIVHSDFKPGNCFLTKSGVIKVFDFGIAQAAKLSGPQHGEVTKFDPGTLGALTPAYASCEMIDGEPPDPRDDIYAFGCVIYELLTGKHPFNKKSAAEARDQKLAPLPIKKLTRRQWRALAKSLAFRREDRSANIDELLSGLAKQPFNPALIAVGVAAVLVVAVVGYFGVLQWEQQQSNRLVEALQSGDDGRVPAAIEEVRSLEISERDRILGLVRDPLVAWYESLVRRAVDRSAGRYDYPQAERVLDEADVWYSYVGRLDDVRDALSTEKAELLDELYRRYEANLGAGRLLPNPSEDDIAEVLEILVQVDPGNQYLSDEGLTIAYGDQAAAALTREDFRAADELIKLGLARDPNNPVLTDLRGKLSAVEQSEIIEAQVATLRQQLAAASSMETVEEMRRLEPAVLELAKLAPPEDASLRAFYERLGAALTREVEAQVETREFGDAQRTIESVAGLLPTAYSAAATRLVTAGRGDYDAELGRLVAAVRSAVEARRWSDAQSSLRELSRIGADANTFQQASALLENGYVEVVNELVGANRFREATDTLTSGLEFDAGFSRLAGMRNTISDAEQRATQADAAERERQRLATEQTQQRAIEAFFALQTPTVEDAKKALAAADQLAAVAPAHALAGRSSHERIATKLAERATAIGTADLDGQVGFLNDALGLIGDSQTLRSALDDALGRQAQLAADQRAQRVATLRQALDNLLANPRSEESWVTGVREQLTGIRSVAGADDAGAAAAQQRAAEIMLARSAAARERRQFPEAESLLGFARGLAPRLDGLAAEQQRLADARAVLQQEEAQRAAAARVERLKQTFLERAKNDRINEAGDTLKELRQLLGAQDEFLTATAPRAMIDIYVRLARGAFDRGEFARADEIVARGLGEYDAAALRALSGEINTARTARLQRNVDALAVMLDGGTRDADQAKILLESIKTDAGTAYTAQETQLWGKATARANSNPRDSAYAQFVTALFSRELPPRPVSCEPGLQGTGGNNSGRCFDLVSGAIRGPLLVVVPGIGGGAPFGIGRTELRISDWNNYCRLSTRCAEITLSRQDSGDYPVTNVAVAAVVEYAAWLSQATGFKYRLPTTQEWVHAASAAPGARLDHNCNRVGDTRVVTAGSANEWGLADLFGNVREWVTTAGGYEARGGDYTVRVEQCTANKADPSTGDPDARTGFRLVRELQRTAQ